MPPKNLFPRLWSRNASINYSGRRRMSGGQKSNSFADSFLSQKILNSSTINPSIINVEYAVRGPIAVRASEIQNELNQGASKPFKSVLRTNIGDCHAVGQVPITYFRQVLANALFPELKYSNFFPRDVVEKADSILKAFNGSLGCYTESMGSAYVRKNVAKFISERDGFPSDPNNIFLTNGASGAVKLILFTLIKKYSDGKSSGILVPIPQYPLYSATIAEFDGSLLSYYLNESNNWELDIEECERALAAGKDISYPKAMVVINPGNPTGQVLTYENMVQIVKFCKNNNLILLADEVYQHNVYDQNLKFHSFKKVVLESGFTENDFELVSFHSVSKGYFGECGLRGGYMELFGFDSYVKSQLVKLVSAQLCSSSVGQVLVDCVVAPPVPNEPSYKLFMEEKAKVLTDLKTKAQLMHEELNSIPGIKCNPLQGAMYAFPRLDLPPRVVKTAREENMTPDEFYCFKLLEQTGICVVPGSGFKQVPNTYHFRTTILPPVDSIKNMANILKDFHISFIKNYS